VKAVIYGLGSLNVTYEIIVRKLKFYKRLYLWPPCVIGQAIIFLPCGFFLSSIFLFFLA